MIHFKEFAQLDYVATLEAMQQFTQQRDANTVDEVWFLEHPPVFTLGTSANSKDFLLKSEIPSIQTDRGGQITYHGPGQLIIYVLFDLRRRQIQIKPFVHLLEKCLISALQDAGIDAHAWPEYPGIYVNHCKIASIGLKLKEGMTYHGISLNMNMDLTPFGYINPCGMNNIKMLNVTDLVANVDKNKMIELCKKYFLNYF